MEYREESELRREAVVNRATHRLKEFIRERTETTMSDLNAKFQQVFNAAEMRAIVDGLVANGEVSREVVPCQRQGRPATIMKWIR